MTETTNRGLVPTAAMATAVAVVLALIVYFIAQAATDNLLVDTGGDQPEEVPAFGVVTASIVGGALGTLVAWLTGRFTSRPRQIFLVVCVFGLLLSFTNPFVAAEETATAIWLSLMHIVVAIPVVGSLARYLPDVRG